MSVSLKGNFFQNARGITFIDGGGVTWSFNYATNTITATAAGGTGVGTVTSVGLGSTDFTVTGSPITTSGTITANLATQVGLTAGSYTYAALTVNSKGVITAVASGAAPPTSANPSGKVGATAVNGSATTFMRSDAAPPIDLTISATWTGNWVFTPSGGVTTFNGLSGSGNYAVHIQGGTTAGDRGIKVSGGTSSSDYCVVLTNAAATVNLGLFYGDGSVTLAKGLGVNGAAPPAQVTGFGTPTAASLTTNFPGTSATLAQCGGMLSELITILKAAGIIGA